MGKVIIGLIGGPGDGKGAVKRHLVQRHGFTVMQFTDSARDMLRAIGLTDDQFEGAGRHQGIAEFGGVTPNALISSLTHAWGRRMVHTDMWNLLLRAKLDRVAGPVVVDDIRYFNEADTIRAAGGENWQVINPDAPAGNATQQVRQIPAERDLLNDRSILALTGAIDALLDRYGEKR